MERPEYWLRLFLEADWSAPWWVVGGFLVAVLGNVGFLVTGYWMEQRRERRLHNPPADVAAILLLRGPAPPGTVTGAAHLVSASYVMSPPPIGRLSARLRSLIGGRHTNSTREVEQARREVLFRLREQAAAVGATVLAGVELNHMMLGRHRSALFATGTALCPPGPPAANTGGMTEALGAEPPRSRLAVVLTVGGLVLLALLGSWMSNSPLFNFTEPVLKSLRILPRE